MRSGWLLYYPYPPYSPWPDFEPLAGFIAMLPAAAGLLLPAGRAATAASPGGQHLALHAPTAAPAVAPVAAAPHWRSLVMRLLSGILLIWRH